MSRNHVGPQLAKLACAMRWLAVDAGGAHDSQRHHAELAALNEAEIAGLGVAWHILRNRTGVSPLLHISNGLLPTSRRVSRKIRNSKLLVF